MECRTATHKFRTRLGFKQYGIILTKEQLAQTKIRLKEKAIYTQYSVLSYKIDLYFHDYKLPVDENVYSDRNIHYEIKW